MGRKKKKNKIRRKEKKKEDYSVRISKNLSWILRHGALQEGINMDDGGWVKLKDILKHPNFKKVNAS